MSENTLHDLFFKVMNEYGEVFNEVYRTKKFDNPFGSLIRKEIPEAIISLTGINQEIYKVEGKCGIGRWATVPYIPIFDKRITTSAKKGAYIVYLINKDRKEMTLVFGIGTTDGIGKYKKDAPAVVASASKKLKPGQIDTLKEKCNEIREKIGSATDLIYDEDNNSGAEGYDAASIYNKKYKIDSLPNDKELKSDLLKYLEVYEKYYEIYHEEMKEKNPTKKSVKKDEESVKDKITCIKEYIASSGFSYEDGLVENFFLSLKSKPFVILAGTSGTGKTRLVKLFADAIGAKCFQVPVRPDWSDGSDLFGYTNINGNFIEGPICAAFKEALANKNQPVILCLDEMNLARVEYYLSDYLSTIELREKKDNGDITTGAIAQYPNGIPDNLYVVGTVNMDETTFPFSKKVLDRANTIEFSYVNLNPSFDGIADLEKLKLSNNFLRAEYLVLSRDCAEERAYVEKLCLELQRLNMLLSKANAHIGYRVRDEIVFYMLNNKKYGFLLPEETAFDNEIMQKILPRIQGSSSAIKLLLIDLFKFCMESGSGIDPDTGNVGEQMKNAASSAKYPESAKKIGYMMTKYEDDGFTSYWL